MNEQDYEAFEKWWGKPFITNDEGVHIEEYCKDYSQDAWQACAEYKDAKAQRLVEALERVRNLHGEFTNTHYILNDALEEYRGEK
jgi:hypothetical protein